MADITLKTTFKLRRGTSTEWMTLNPVLAEGEPAFATDTGVLKIGNGVTHYNNLPSVNSNVNLNVIRGYYYNNNFYVDAEHTVECTKNLNYFYIDKTINGNLYTWDGTNFTPSIKIDNKSISNNNGLEIKGYTTATNGQIPTKNDANGISWINQDEPLNRSEIIEVLK